MAILTLSGRAALAAALKARPLHLAWGAGDPAWDDLSINDYPPSTADTALVNEIGRRALTLSQFVIEDEDGAITVNDVDDPTIKKKFSPSPEGAATNHLYLLFNFDFEDAPAATIREIGIFADTATHPDLPPGQKYFTPGEIVSPGILVALERLPFFNRQPSVRQTFEQVITI
ncbi:MAG: hypothetical protein LBO79_03330 [Zoogloeaceae bacterium]|jgi:hypothetical protein|nr:hypothetical protein [Zoogloeaceae bacterium]